MISMKLRKGLKIPEWRDTVRNCHTIFFIISDLRLRNTR